MIVGFWLCLCWWCVSCHGLSATSRAKRRQRGLVQTGNTKNAGGGASGNNMVVVQQVPVVDTTNNSPLSSTSSLSSASLSSTSFVTTVDDNDDNNEKERLWNMAGQTSRRKRQRGRQSTQTLREDSIVVSLANPLPTTPTTTTTKENTNDNRIKKKTPLWRDSLSIATPMPEENTIANIEIIYPSQSNDNTTSSTTILADITLVNGTILRGVDPTTLHQRHDHTIWMALRKAMNVTASELSAIVGNSVFTTREKLLHVKSGLHPSSSSSSSSSPPPMNRQACEWGLKMEPKALKQYCEVSGNQVQETGLHIRQFFAEQQENSSTDSPDSTTATADAPKGAVPPMVLLVGASPDGLVIDAKDQTRGVLEIKSLWGRRNKKELPQFKHCPQRFWDQIQGQMAVCDVEWCDLIMYIPPNSPQQQRQRRGSQKNYCILRIPRDRSYWKQTLLPAIQSFCMELEELRTTTRLNTDDATSNISNDLPIEDQKEE